MIEYRSDEDRYMHEALVKLYDEASPYLGGGAPKRKALGELNEWERLNDYPITPPNGMVNGKTPAERAFQEKLSALKDDWRRQGMSTPVALKRKEN